MRVQPKARGRLINLTGLSAYAPFGAYGTPIRSDPICCSFSAWIYDRPNLPNSVNVGVLCRCLTVTEQYEIMFSAFVKHLLNNNINI